MRRVTIALVTSYVLLAECEMLFSLKPLFLVDLYSKPLIKDNLIYFIYVRHLLLVRTFREVSRIIIQFIIGDTCRYKQLTYE
jgi:hypothetical protein